MIAFLACAWAGGWLERMTTGVLCPVRKSARGASRDPTAPKGSSTEGGVALDKEVAGWSTRRLIPDASEAPGPLDSQRPRRPPAQEEWSAGLPILKRRLAKGRETNLD